MPTKKVKYNKHKHKQSEWITKGIIKSTQFRDNLYLQMKRTSPNTIEYTTIKTNLKTYNKILKNNIDQAKRTYYQHSFDKYKNDTKNTWKIIKEITNRNNIKKHIPCLFNVEGETITDKSKIANKLNTYFTKIGPTLASKINTNGNKTFDSFLSPPIAHKFTFSSISETEVIQIINKLPSKSSSGDDLKG